MALQQFVVIHPLQFLKYVMIDKNSLNLAFESRLYRSMLDKKTKKDKKQFDDKFVEEMEEVSKSGKKLSLTNKQLGLTNQTFGE